MPAPMISGYEAFKRFLEVSFITLQTAADDVLRRSALASWRQAGEVFKLSSTQVRSPGVKTASTSS